MSIRTVPARTSSPVRPATIVHDSERAAAIFHFLNLLVDSFLKHPKFLDAAFKFPKGPSGPSLDYDEIEYEIAGKTVHRAVIAVESFRGDHYTVSVEFDWQSYILSTKFPNSPLRPETEIYDCITKYAIPVREGKRGVIVFDSSDHEHPIRTYPHHMHEIVNNINQDPQNFSGLISDLVEEIAARV